MLGSNCRACSFRSLTTLSICLIIAFIMIFTSTAISIMAAAQYGKTLLVYRFGARDDLAEGAVARTGPDSPAAVLGITERPESTRSRYLDERSRAYKSS